MTLENIDVICRGAGEARSREAMSTPGPDVAGEYPCVTMFGHVLPSYGLWVEKADNFKMRNVRFRIRPGDVDLRPAVVR